MTLLALTHARSYRCRWRYRRPGLAIRPTKCQMNLKTCHRRRCYCYRQCKWCCRRCLCRRGVVLVRMPLCGVMLPPRHVWQVTVASRNHHHCFRIPNVGSNAVRLFDLVGVPRQPGRTRRGCRYRTFSLSCRTSSGHWPVRWPARSPPRAWHRPWSRS